MRLAIRSTPSCLQQSPIDTPEAEDGLRAVVSVTSGTKKGTSRAGQEYESPLLVLTGTEYAAMPFADLHSRRCDALRGSGPRVVAQLFLPDSPSKLVSDDGTTATQDESVDDRKVRP